ncbi:MAG: preprotein translocase subunit YajC [bacterium]
MHSLAGNLTPLAQAAPPSGGAASIIPLVMMVGMVMMFYFVIVALPQRRMLKERQALLGSLKKNDRIITSGGIYGTVVAVDAEQDRVTVRICDEPAVRIQLNVRSVIQILREEKQA